MCQLMINARVVCLSYACLECVCLLAVVKFFQKSDGRREQRRQVGCSVNKIKFRWLIAIGDIRPSRVRRRQGYAGQGQRQDDLGFGYRRFKLSTTLIGNIYFYLFFLFPCSVKDEGDFLHCFCQTTALILFVNKIGRDTHHPAIPVQCCLSWYASTRNFEW
ncbi:hypothetical protein B0T13DRAFT_232063 [Neurospora crassa]|nr:hypothetical protein B0T13DRAFT_232063 [Neurospora crassa]